MMASQHAEPLYVSLYREWRNHIIAGTLPAHTKLPSIRQMVKKRQLSKTTVERAYTQLLIEGYIDSRERSGYYVVPLQALPKFDQKPIDKHVEPCRYLNLGQPTEPFDLATLRKAYQHILLDVPCGLFRPADTAGEPALRKAILQHLVKTREVTGTFQQVLIAAGIQNHLMLLASLRKPRSVAFIEPLFDRAKVLFDLLGITLVPCEDFNALCAVHADWFYLSPSNSYPGGAVLSISDRLKAIKHAKQHDAWIIEDDYNHLFRYNAYQIPAIQGLAKGERVVYIGSFSRTMPLSLRISYMLVPEPFHDMMPVQLPLAQTVSTLDQLAMTEFLVSGAYARQLRKLSATAKRLNSLLHALVDTHPSSTIRVWGLESNMHMMLSCQTYGHYKKICHILKQNRLYYSTFPSPPHTVMLPYGGLSETTLTKLMAELLT